MFDRIRIRLTHGSSFAIAFIVMVFGLTATAADPKSPDQRVMSYLDQTIAWERSIAGLDQAPISTQDVVYRETVHQSARQALQLGFQAARAQAVALSAQAPPPPT